MDSSSDEDFSTTVIPKPTRITSEIEQLIGKANQFFINEEFDKAIELFHDVIKKAPGISDPYHTLGLIYEEKKEHEKAANFYMLAAQVTQHDSDLWAKVAHMQKELGHYKDAIYCFSRCLLNRRTPEVEIMKEKAVCHERLEQYRKAGKIYSKILKISPNCDATVAKALVEVYQIMKQPRIAVKELKEILDAKYDDNLANLLCDLYIQLSEFSVCIDLLENLGKSAFPLDIEVKKGYCLARLGRLSEADSCFEGLLQHSVQYYDDLYLLVGNLYMDLDQHESALKFLEPLLALERHNKPPLWFKCAKLYYEINDQVSAEEAFKSVITSQEFGLATQSKLFLSKIYKSKGEIDKSISILKSKNLEVDETFELSEEVICDLISNAKLKIAESCLKKDLTDFHTFLDSLIETELKLELKKRDDIVQNLGPDSLHEVFDHTITYFISNQNFSQAKEFVLKILKLNMYKGDYRLNMKKKLTQICVMDRDYEQGLNAFKYVCEKENTESNWIVLSSLMRNVEKPQLRSWLCKVANRSQNNYAVHMLLGNSYFQTGNYGLAIKQYLLVYDNENALINLQLGLCYLFCLCSKNIQKKDEVFFKAFKHLKLYVSIRKKTNYLEAYYNLARAYHHTQYYTKACYNYEKVLMAYSRASALEISKSESLPKYMRLSANNLIVIKNTLEDFEGAKSIAYQWLGESYPDTDPLLSLDTQS